MLECNCIFNFSVYLPALSSPDDKVKLLKEVLVMVPLKHPNVMSLLGMCYDEETPLLIMPYMSGGNILKFVRHNKVALHVDEGTKDSTQVGTGYSLVS